MTKPLEALIAKIKKQLENFDTVILKEDEAKALIAALEQSRQRVYELEKQYEERTPTEWAYNQACKVIQNQKDKIAELEASHAQVIQARDYYKKLTSASQLAVKLHKRSVGEVMHMSGFSLDYAEGWCAGNDNAIHEARAAGITVQGDES